VLVGFALLGFHAAYSLPPPANFKLAFKAREILGIMLDMDGLDVENTPSSFLFDPAHENERRWTCGNCMVAPMSGQDLVSSVRTLHPLDGLLTMCV
jgi:hypothetical protein